MLFPVKIVVESIEVVVEGAFTLSVPKERRNVLTVRSQQLFCCYARYGSVLLLSQHPYICFLDLFYVSPYPRNENHPFQTQSS